MSRIRVKGEKKIAVLKSQVQEQPMEDVSNNHTFLDFPKPKLLKPKRRKLLDNRKHSL